MNNSSFYTQELCPTRDPRDACGCFVIDMCLKCKFLITKRKIRTRKSERAVLKRTSNVDLAITRDVGETMIKDLVLAPCPPAR